MGLGDIFFWFDYWSDDISIFDKFHNLSFENSDVSKYAKVKELWRQREWRPHYPNNATIDTA